MREISDNIFYEFHVRRRFFKDRAPRISEQVSEQEELGRNLEIFQRRGGCPGPAFYFKTPNF